MAASRLCLTTDEAAGQLHISRSKLYQLLRDGTIPHIKVGRKILIPSAELKEWIHTHST